MHKLVGEGSDRLVPAMIFTLGFRAIFSAYATIFLKSPRLRIGYSVAGIILGVTSIAYHISLNYRYVNIYANRDLLG